MLIDKKYDVVGAVKSEFLPNRYFSEEHFLSGHGDKSNPRPAKIENQS